MSAGEIASIMQDAVYTAIIASAPLLVVAIVIGLLVSIFQATTQINEQTLAFTPKFVAILLSLLLFGGFIITTLSDFFVGIFGYMNNYVG